MHWDLSVQRAERAMRTHPGSLQRSALLAPLLLYQLLALPPPLHNTPRKAPKASSPSSACMHASRQQPSG